MPLFAMAFGPGVNHDASCETACLVLSRGGVRLDAALAMLQALLDGGEALRVQGYLSFLPSDIEPPLKGEASAAGAGMSAFPPPPERLWGLPMVTIEGIYRGQLCIRALNTVAEAGLTAQQADESGRPWQETAAQAGAGDRGACKVFVCGRGLDEHALRMQLARTLGLGFQGPLCDLESLWPVAGHVLEELGTSAMAVFKTMAPLGAAAGGGPAGRQVGAPALAEERSSAEAFARTLVAALCAQAVPIAAPGAARQALEARISLPSAQGRPPEAATLRWQNGAVSVRHVPRALAPLGRRDHLTSGADLRVCVEAAKEAGSCRGEQEAEVHEELQVLVVGTVVYGRRRQ